LFSFIQTAMRSVGDFSKPYKMIPSTNGLQVGLSAVLKSWLLLTDEL
jgi:hypothetical protein